MSNKIIKKIALLLGVGFMLAAVQACTEALPQNKQYYVAARAEQIKRQNARKIINARRENNAARLARVEKQRNKINQRLARKRQQQQRALAARKTSQKRRETTRIKNTQRLTRQPLRMPAGIKPAKKTNNNSAKTSVATQTNQQSVNDANDTAVIVGSESIDTAPPNDTGLRNNNLPSAANDSDTEAAKTTYNSSDNRNRNLKNDTAASDNQISNSDNNGGAAKTVLSGKSTKIGYFSSFTKDCKPGILPTLSIKAKPKFGDAWVAKSFSTVRKGKCAGKTFPTMAVYYRSNSGYKGNDTITVIGANIPGKSKETVRTSTIKINVR